MRLAALMLCLSACAPTPWLITRHCTEPYPFPLKLEYCSDLNIPYAACLYTHSEQDLECRWQMERTACDGMWDLVAHECGIYVPPGSRPLPARYGGDMQPGCRWVPDRDRGMMVLADDCEAKP